MSSKCVFVSILSNGKEYEYRLLCDSGNRLSDPYFHLPVIVMKESHGEKLKSNLPTRLIVMETVAGKGFAPTITPEKVFILKDGRKIEISVAICFVKDENLNISYDGVFPQRLAENL